MPEVRLVSENKQMRSLEEAFLDQDVPQKGKRKKTEVTQWGSRNLNLNYPSFDRDDIRWYKNWRQCLA